MERIMAKRINHKLEKSKELTKIISVAFLGICFIYIIVLFICIL